MKSVIVFFLLFTGCSSGEYKKADLGFYNGYDGYFDKQIAPGKYVLEYNNTSMGTGSYKKHDEITTLFWKNRAAELCPQSYSGNSEMIFRMDAKLKILQSDLVGFNQFKIASGIIECKK